VKNFLTILLCLTAVTSADVGGPYNPEDGPPEGFELVARENCGVPGMQPHKVRGSDKSAGDGTDSPLASYNVADNWDRAVVYRFEGLNPQAAYKLRVAIPATPGNKQQMTANGRWLGAPPRPSLFRPEANYTPGTEPLHLEFDLSSETVKGGELELRFANREGSHAVVSLIELWADRPVTLAPVFSGPRILGYNALEKSVWRPIKYEGRPFFFMVYGNLKDHRKGGAHSRFAYEAALQGAYSPIWEDETLTFHDKDHWHGVEEWGFHTPVDGATKPDCHTNRRNWFDSRLAATRAEGKKLFSLNGHVWLEPYAAAWGADLISTEWGAGSRAVQARLALLRGAARQNCIPFSTQTSPWYGGGLVIYEDGEGDETARKGHSAPFFSRTWHLAWLSGAACTTPEAAQMKFFHRRPEQKWVDPWNKTPIGNDQPEDKRFKLTPTGLKAKEFVSLIGKHKDIGIPYTPFALIMDEYAGFSLNPGMGGVSPWFRLAPTAGDMETATFLDSVFPGTVLPKRGDQFSESRMMVNAPYGETFDILLSNAGTDVLSTYPVAVLLGDHQLTPEFRKTLLTYLGSGGHVVLNLLLAGQLGADLATFRDAGRLWIEPFTKDERSVNELMSRLAQLYLPIDVKGDIQYTINRTPTGWLVGLFDNKGAWKEGDGPVLFSKKPQTVTLSPKEGVIRSALEWCDRREIPVVDNRVTLDVPPGGVRIVELRDEMK
jgi:hypothetical protein